MTAGKVFHGGKLRKDDWDEAQKDSEREEHDFDKQDWTLFPDKPAGGFTIGSNVVAALDTIRKSIQDVSEYVTSTAAAVEEQSVVTGEMSTSMQRAADEAKAIAG